MKTFINEIPRTVKILELETVDETEFMFQLRCHQNAIARMSRDNELARADLSAEFKQAYTKLHEQNH